MSALSLPLPHVASVLNLLDSRCLSAVKCEFISRRDPHEAFRCQASWNWTMTITCGSSHSLRWQALSCKWALYSSHEPNSGVMGTLYESDRWESLRAFVQHRPQLCRVRVQFESLSSRIWWIFLLLHSSERDLVLCAHVQIKTSHAEMDIQGSGPL